MWKSIWRTRDIWNQDMFYWKYQTSLFDITNWQHGYFKELYRVTQHFSCTVPLIWRIVYTCTSKVIGTYEEVEKRQGIKYFATGILYMSITYFPFHKCAVSSSGSVYVLASNAKFSLALQPKILVYQRLMVACPLKLPL